MIVAGNWKMNKTPSEAVAFVRDLAPRVEGAKATVVVGVPFVALDAVVGALRGTEVKVAAQNVHYEAKGAYTGEVSAGMIKDIGAQYVIIGHSERRQYFAETDEAVNKKVHAAMAAGLAPIVCIGESLTEREQGVTAEVLRKQAKIALIEVSSSQIEASGLVVAYEPIWAIGTGRTATNEQADEACGIIRCLLAELYGEGVAAKTPIQYGGSVTAANAKDLFAQKNVDGGLVGGASLKLDDFETIVKSA